MTVEPLPEDFGHAVARFLERPVGELFEWPVCALCGSDGRDTVVIEEFARTPLQIVRCTECGFCYSWPRPTAWFAGIIHDPHSRNSMVDAGILPEARRMWGDAIFDYDKQTQMDQTYRQGLREIARRAPRGTLLDVGCAGGRFVELALEAGYEAIGVDVQSAPLTRGREELGLDLRLCAPNELPADLPPITVVTLWNVLEHVSEPVELLTAIRRVVTDGGVLLLDVPNFAFRLVQWRLRGISRPACQRFMPQDHINHFTASTLRRMLGTAGFSVAHFSLAHADGATGARASFRRGAMRTIHAVSAGRVNWHHPLSCLACKQQGSGPQRATECMRELT